MMYLDIYYKNGRVSKTLVAREYARAAKRAWQNDRRVQRVELYR